MEHVVLAQHSILLLRSLLQIKCLRGSAWHPAAQCSHYARHSLARSPCQQLPWQPQPKACKRSLTENEGKENIGGKKEC